MQATHGTTPSREDRTIWVYFKYITLKTRFLKTKGEKVIVPVLSVFPSPSHPTTVIKPSLWDLLFQIYLFNKPVTLFSSSVEKILSLGTIQSGLTYIIISIKGDLYAHRPSLQYQKSGSATSRF